MSPTAGTAAQPGFKPALWTPGDWRRIRHDAGRGLAYAVVAAGFFAVEKFSASTATVSLPEMPLAAPAE
jgi:hypothetical protein